MSTAEMLNRRDQTQKEKAKNLRKRTVEQQNKLADKARADVVVDDLTPLNELLAPVQSILEGGDGLRAQMDTAKKRLSVLEAVQGAVERAGEEESRQSGAKEQFKGRTPSAPSSTAPAGKGAAPAAAGEGAASGGEGMSRASATKLMRKVAEDVLAEMASSLDGALADDGKLRELFERIDTDQSGTIDKDELRVAVNQMGRKLSDELIDGFFLSVDSDGNGQIDLDEFKSVLRGVKATNAAVAIQKQHHARRAARAGAAAAKPRHGEAGTKKVSAVDLGRLLGETLLSKNINPKELVHIWDRSRDGEISRAEFRLGVRENLGIKADNAAIDLYFEKFDADGGGSIDLPELRDALDWLRERAANERRERLSVMVRVNELGKRILELESAAVKATEASGALQAEIAQLKKHRSALPLDAKVGSLLHPPLPTTTPPPT